MAARSCPGAEVSASAGTAASDGVGTIGDSIGAVDTRCMAAAGTTRGAIRFITAAITTGRGARAEVTASEAKSDPALTQATDLPAETPEVAAERLTAAALPRGLSTGIPEQLEDTLSPAVKAARDRVRLVVTQKADRPEATRRAAAPAWAAECGAVVVAMAVAVDTDNRRFYYIAEFAKCELERSDATNHAEFR